MFQIHKCELQPDNVSIIHDEQLEENGAWRMQITRQVTEEDLEENHYFDTTDDIAWQTTVEIACCPYCGDRLIESKLENGQWQAKIVHFDFSGWSVKRW